MNGQMKRISWVLEQFLQICAKPPQYNWTELLPWIEFSHKFSESLLVNLSLRWSIVHVLPLPITPQPKVAIAVNIKTFQDTWLKVLKNFEDKKILDCKWVHWRLYYLVYWMRYTAGKGLSDTKGDHLCLTAYQEASCKVSSQTFRSPLRWKIECSTTAKIVSYCSWFLLRVPAPASPPVFCCGPTGLGHSSTSVHTYWRRVVKAFDAWRWCQTLVAYLKGTSAAAGARW